MCRLARFRSGDFFPQHLPIFRALERLRWSCGSVSVQVRGRGGDTVYRREGSFEA